MCTAKYTQLTKQEEEVADRKLINKQTRNESTHLLSRHTIQSDNIVSEGIWMVKNKRSFQLSNIYPFMFAIAIRQVVRLSFFLRSILVCYPSVYLSLSTIVRNIPGGVKCSQHRYNQINYPLTTFILHLSFMFKYHNYGDELFLSVFIPSTILSGIFHEISNTHNIHTSL